MNEDLPKLLRAIAQGTRAKENKHDIILNAAADLIEATRVKVVRWKHVKRGTVYEETGRAELQAAYYRHLAEGDTLVIYRGEDGKLWARWDTEFEDGRFERMADE